jgi:hypothetical protein
VESPTVLADVSRQEARVVPATFTCVVAVATDPLLLAARAGGGPLPFDLIAPLTAQALERAKELTEILKASLSSHKAAMASYG